MFSPLQGVCSVISGNKGARAQTDTDKMMEISKSFVSGKLTVYKSTLHAHTQPPNMLLR